MQEQFNNQLKDCDKKIAKLEKALKALKGITKDKADVDVVLDGQQQFFDDLNANEKKIDDKRNSVLMAEFKRLGDKITAEYTELDKRTKDLEKRTSIMLTKEQVDEKLNRVDFENAMVDL